jgi:serine/threonine-protein kinase
VVEKMMGEGRFGICYLVLLEQKSYILKQLKRGMLRKAREKIHFEEDILKSLQHEGIPRFIEKIELKDFCGYVLEYKEGRTFEDVIYSDKHVFERKEIFSVGRQLVRILKYLHANGIIHRDIRTPNTTYDGQRVSLLDFGLARPVDHKYKTDLDFAFLGDFLLHLYYTSFEKETGKASPWHEELKISGKEVLFLKKLMGIEQRYKSILEVEYAFNKVFDSYH